MASKNIEIIQGDTYTMGFRVSGATGPKDFTLPGTRLYAHITDPSGRRVLAKFKIIPINMANGEFRIHLDSNSSVGLRGKNLWSVRYEIGDLTTTLAGGTISVRAGA